MLKYVEEWKLIKSIEREHKVYVRGFPGAKVKCMKDYVKSSVQENDQDHVILHIGTNELHSELPPGRTCKIRYLYSFN